MRKYTKESTIFPGEHYIYEQSEDGMFYMRSPEPEISRTAYTEEHLIRAGFTLLEEAAEQKKIPERAECSVFGW